MNVTHLHFNICVVRHQELKTQDLLLDEYIVESLCSGFSSFSYWVWQERKFLPACLQDGQNPSHSAPLLMPARSSCIKPSMSKDAASSCGARPKSTQFGKQRASSGQLLNRRKVDWMRQLLMAKKPLIQWVTDNIGRFHHQLKAVIYQHTQDSFKVHPNCH